MKKHYNHVTTRLIFVSGYFGPHGVLGRDLVPHPTKAQARSE